MNKYIVKINESSIPKFNEIKDAEKAKKIYFEALEIAWNGSQYFEEGDYVEVIENFVEIQVYEVMENGEEKYAGGIRDFSFWWDKECGKYEENLKQVALMVQEKCGLYCTEYDMENVCTNSLGDIDYDMMLIIGAKHGNLDVVKEALENGAYIHYKDYIDYMTPIEHSNCIGHKEITRYLKEHGAVL